MEKKSKSYAYFRAKICRLFEIQDPRNRTSNIIARIKRRIFRALMARALRQYAEFVMANSEVRGYFSVKPYIDDRITGEEYLNDQTINALARTMQAFLAKGGHFPNLLKPSRFSEFLLLYKVLGRIPMPSPEDKLRNMHYVPKEVEHLLTKHYRPFISSTPRLPDVEGLEPGYYWLKTNYGCGHHERFKFPPTDVDLVRMKELISVWLGKKHFTVGGVWWDEKVVSSVYLERHLSDQDCEVEDWKFFVFFGRVEIVQVDMGRFEDHKQNVYDRSFAPMEHELYFERGLLSAKPKRFDDMVAVAEAIGRSFDFIRVDLFAVNNDIFLGEIGIAPNGARTPVRSVDLDERLGHAWISGAERYVS